MAPYVVRQFGDHVLTQRSLEVTDIDGKLVKLAEDMVETMHEAHGLGLAAPQVGVQKRLFVYQMPDREPVTIVNPRIEESRGEWEYEEG
ncbi:MAG: peptide deformylase, partial [Acidimicrobiales bacterium]|nr:peptide deformylase [Acidimicrobiales bacterium]